MSQKAEKALKKINDDFNAENKNIDAEEAEVLSKRLMENKVPLES